MSLQGVSPQWTAAYAYKGSNGEEQDEEEFVVVSIDEEGHDTRRSAGVVVDRVHNTTTRGHHNNNNNNDSSSSILSIHISMQEVMSAMQKAFIATNDDFISIHPQSESSGSTATIAVLFSTHVVIAHVGDSRAMLCCDVDGRAFPLTSDHTPYLPTERSRIEDCGGWIEDYGVLRVNGQLAVTRSLGDRRFRRVLISNPDVLVFRRHHHHHHHYHYQISSTKINGDTDSDMSSTREESISSSQVVMTPCEAYHMLYRSRSHYDSTVVSTASYPPPQQFLVIASDGLWDVMTEQDVADFVCDHLGLYLSIPSSGNDSFDNNSSRRNHVSPLLPIDAFHETAKLLAQEAYVRGSMDNIGVCLIDLY
jgi:serine/threonine protein phosphatase PrpC